MPRIYTRLPLAERFWARVEKSDGCWLWTGAIQSSTGYGRIARGDPSAKPRIEGAHRVAYELQCGPIPAGTSVLHTCDRRACCRGSHLFLGTAKDNSADMYAKGRNIMGAVHRGEASVSSILSEQQVREILASQDTHKALGLRFGVAPATIKAVRDGITWKHVGPARAPHGRRRLGSEHRGAKLTEANVLAIRASQEPTNELARRFGVEGATIAAARWGETWSHLPPSEHDRSVIEQLGEKHHNAKLTAEAVRQIRASPLPSSALAAIYGVTPSNIDFVRNGKTWRHVS